VGRSRGSYRGRPRSSGLSREWGLGPGGTAVTLLSASGSSLLGSAITPAGGEITVMRTRGIFEASIVSQPDADGSGFFGAVGIGLATAAAHTAGIASLPTPITEAGWDGWLWHYFFSVHVNDITFAPNVDATQRVEIDSKGMRKLDAFGAIYAAVEVVEIGAASVNVFLDSRILLQDSGR